MAYKEVDFDKVGKIAKDAGDYYQNNIKIILDEKIKTLEKILLDFVEKYEDEYDLVRDNDSSKRIRLYEMSSRTKSRDSLIEKIVRNNEFYSLVDVDEPKSILLASNDDLMGLRFLVSLSCDCKKLYKVFLEKATELHDNNVFFFNLEDNPQVMNNKRSIYRLKGEYESYPFELQIKSKVDSAWADIEHMLFYKDYQFSYIRNTNQGVMNRIGDLLDKIDELMIQIRESQDQYELEKAKLEFNARLDKRYRKFIKDTINSMSILREGREILYYVFSSLEQLKRTTISDYLDENEGDMRLKAIKLSRDVDGSSFIENYRRQKSTGIELVLFEHIYADWIHGLRRRGDVDEETFNLEEVKNYYRSIIEAIIQTKMKYLVDNRMTIDELKNFSKYTVDMLIILMDKEVFSINERFFVFNENILYMLFCFWKCLYQVQDENESDEEERKLFSLIIIRFLFSRDDIEANHLFSIYEDSLGGISEKIINSEFVKCLNDEYLKLEKTKSGKKLKESVIVSLFDIVLDLKRKSEEC